MEHVGESFSVHQAVLDGGFQHGQKLGMALTGTRQGIVNRGIQLRAQPRVVFIHFAARGPIARLIGRQAPIDGVDPESEQAVKRFVEGR